MSLETWKAEFYPVNANVEMSEEEAIKHSIKKWEGLKPENLSKHFVELDFYGDIIEPYNIEFSEFSISNSSCALCAKFYNADENGILTFNGCESCPLYKKLGFECGRSDDDNHAKDGWAYYEDLKSPDLMLENLKSLLTDKQ